MEIYEMTHMLCQNVMEVIKRVDKQKLQTLYNSCSNKLMIFHGPRIFNFIRIARSIISEMADHQIAIQAYVINNYGKKHRTFILLAYENIQWVIDVADDNGDVIPNIKDASPMDVIHAQLPKRYHPFIGEWVEALDVMSFESKKTKLSTIPISL